MTLKEWKKQKETDTEKIVWIKQDLKNKYYVKDGLIIKKIIKINIL